MSSFDREYFTIQTCTYIFIVIYSTRESIINVRQNNEYLIMRQFLLSSRSIIVSMVPKKCHSLSYGFFCLCMKQRFYPLMIFKQIIRFVDPLLVANKGECGCFLQLNYLFRLWFFILQRNKLVDFYHLLFSCLLRRVYFGTKKTSDNIENRFLIHQSTKALKLSLPMLDFLFLALSFLTIECLSFLLLEDFSLTLRLFFANRKCRNRLGTISDDRKSIALFAGMFPFTVELIFFSDDVAIVVIDRPWSDLLPLHGNYKIIIRTKERSILG
jgi:hypothetical protein